MLVIQGSPALSEFRIEKLLRSARHFEPSMRDISTRFVHFIDCTRELQDVEREVLEKLLTYGEDASISTTDHLLLVVPRLGTISPWSSKATEIAHGCGLDAVHRIERGVAYHLELAGEAGNLAANQDLLSLFHDRMTESVLFDYQSAAALFSQSQPRPLNKIPLTTAGRAALEQANADYGLALSTDELDYLLENYRRLGRDPTDVELVMFAQANSEHCRHKIFNADWVLDGEPQSKSLFDMIRDTYRANSNGILSAYKDNAAVMTGLKARRFFPGDADKVYRAVEEDVHVLMKVETHNHPTAISPFPGAATGAGGEIRDEGATGRGAKPKVGLVGFTVSNLKIPGFERPWERDHGKPERIVSALEIMLEGPIGAAAFNNEFGRPNICGYFRTFEHQQGADVRGYHKPIMVAGGLGNIRAAHVEKNEFDPGAKIVVLGGPAMLIGLGGGAASSMDSGSSSADLDFASVQRGNPEMQRRAQEVIDRCWSLGSANPIQAIHDVGAGGLSNAIPEIIHGAKRGGVIELRAVPSDEADLSPMEIWCNEAQERYVLVIAEQDLDAFVELCKRERCPYAVIGNASADERLIVNDSLLENKAVDLPLDVLLGKPPKMLREAKRVSPTGDEFDVESVATREALYRLLQLPTVADKGFLVTIGDRTVGGLVHRDQMVGRWQVPVADAAVSLASFDGYSGEAMAMGERPPVALLNAPASGRLAVSEAISNIAGTAIGNLQMVRLSANWMAAAGHGNEDAALFDTVSAVASEFCSELGLTIPVGKDSLSMRTRWEQGGMNREVVAPLSLIVSAFAPVIDVRKTVTADLKTADQSTLLLIDLGEGKNRTGGSCLAQVYGKLGDAAPDLENAELLKRFFHAMQDLVERGLLLAYHDRSDGGTLICAIEMAIAGRQGVCLEPGGESAVNAELFNEEIGAVIQVEDDNLAQVQAILNENGLANMTRTIGKPIVEPRVQVTRGGKQVIDESLEKLIAAWSSTSFHMQALRDNPKCAEEEFAQKQSLEDPGLSPRLSFDPEEKVVAPVVTGTARPRVAILREQGVNGQVEMAAAFDRAGFEAIDVHMTDILAGRETLESYNGLAACGGFSYGDVLGAGEGWAKSILFNSRARDVFQAFFEDSSTFSLGVCNGCQMLSALHELIPGSEGWPLFGRNRSEQFEGRLCQVEVLPSKSVFFQGMQGSRIPIVVSNGEGRAWFEQADAADKLLLDRRAALRFVDGRGNLAETYPQNPNGSTAGITGVTSSDGRITITMPHPERVFRSVQMSWREANWPEDSPWMRMFYNARRWLD